MSGLKPLNRQPVLSITTRKRRPAALIAIDGRNYEMAVPSDFSQFKQARAMRLQMVVQQINAKEQDDWTDDDIQQVEEAMILLVQLIVPKLPRDVIELMSDDDRNAVVAAFGEEAARINAENAEFESAIDTAVSETPVITEVVPE